MSDSQVHENPFDEDTPPTPAQYDSVFDEDSPIESDNSDEENHHCKNKISDVEAENQCQNINSDEDGQAQAANQCENIHSDGDGDGDEDGDEEAQAENQRENIHSDVVQPELNLVNEPFSQITALAQNDISSGAVNLNDPNMSLQMNFINALLVFET